jgi:hypothetical protein
MPLRALQRDFQSALMAGSTGINPQLVSTPEAGAARRLDIYVQAYRLRLLDALEGDYGKLAACVGDAQFEALGYVYITRYPSQHPSLRWLGRHMADFLATTRPWSGQPLLAEMAAFEWAQGEVFDAPDATPLSLAAIAAIPPESWAGLRLRAHPALRRLDLTWNVPAIWLALDNDTEPPAPRAGDVPSGWLMWRQDLDIHWRSLSADESWAIDAWRSGACFAELCEGLCEWLDTGQVAAHAATLLKGWISAGLVTALLTG